MGLVYGDPERQNEPAVADTTQDLGTRGHEVAEPDNRFGRGNSDVDCNAREALLACQQAADVISTGPIPTSDAARVDLASPTKKKFFGRRLVYYYV